MAYVIPRFCEPPKILYTKHKAVKIRLCLFLNILHMHQQQQQWVQSKNLINVATVAKEKNKSPACGHLRSAAAVFRNSKLRKGHNYVKY